jgi:hypothetical protein
MRRLAVAASAAIVAGCGVVPGDVLGTLPPFRVRAHRAGLGVGVVVTDWTTAGTEMALCAAPLPQSELTLLGPPARPDCLSLDDVSEGLEMRASYSFHGASARRRGAFDDAESWYVVLVYEDRHGSGGVQAEIPGGPVAVP